MKNRKQLVAAGCICSLASMALAQTFAEQGATVLGGFNGNARSGSFGDIDNDGDPDLLVQGVSSARRLFRNNTIGTGMATYTEVQGAGGIVADDTTGWSAAWGDYNGDGFIDVFLGESNLGVGVAGDLFRNEGDSTFTDVSESTINEPGFHQNVGWNDANLDGLPDLLIGMEGPEPHEVYLQNEDGSFTQSGESAGLWIPYSGNSFGKGYGLAVGDYDDDGDYDLYLSTCRSGGNIRNNFFQNRFVEDGFLHYVDIADSNGTQYTPNSYGTEFVDFDDDGDLDLYMTGADAQETKIWRNDGGGTWTDIQTILGHRVLPNDGGDFNGSKAVDYDNDGDLDLYFHDHLASNGENSGRRLFRNDGDWEFVDVTVSEGLFTTNEGAYDSAWADYDLDGDMDLFSPNDSGSPERFFVSNASTNGNHWLFIHPRMNGRNTRAIGAKIHVTIHEGTPEERTLRREANTNAGTFNQSDTAVHFGLGSAATVDRIRIVWPGGSENTWQDIEVDQYITLQQEAGDVLQIQ